MAVDKLKDVSFTEWLKLENAKDPDNTLPPELDFEKAIYFLKNYLLGEDWYVCSPISADQVNTEMIADIMLHIPSAKYRNYPWWKKLFINLKCIFTTTPKYYYY